MWDLHPWRYLELNQVCLWASNREVPGWTGWSPELPSNLNFCMILWLWLHNDLFHIHMNHVMTLRELVSIPWCHNISLVGLISVAILYYVNPDTEPQIFFKIRTLCLLTYSKRDHGHMLNAYYINCFFWRAYIIQPDNKVPIFSQQM